MAKMIEAIVEVRPHVERALGKYPRARNDDTYCYMMANVMAGKAEFVDGHFVFHKDVVPLKPESVRRVRQVIQHVEKRYLPTLKKIRDERKRQSQLVRGYFRSKGCYS